MSFPTRDAWVQPQPPSFGYTPREQRPYMPPMPGTTHYTPSSSERTEKPKERTGDSPLSEELQIDEGE